MAERSKLILVTGAGGFIGRALEQKLASLGRRVRGLYRTLPPPSGRSTDAIEGDLLKPETLPPALEGVETAYYLIHSLNARRGQFCELDRQAAENFIKAAEQAGVSRIIYLSGLGQADQKLSDHLGSRSEVADILQQCMLPVTTLRAAIVIGAGGASFELLRYLVKTQVLLLDSKQLDTRCQPIALTDVISYLCGCLDVEATAGRSFDIGGPEILSYRQLLDRIAAVSKTVNLYLPVPAIPASLVGRWVGLFSRQSSGLVQALVEGLSNEVICHEEQIRKLLPVELTPLDHAIDLALKH
jgi:uncharacterized protein YbjT (DUF2867 family)